MSRFIACVGFGLLLGLLFACVETFGQCPLYLAPSKMAGAGRGIVAGVNFTEGETVEHHTSITVVHDLIRDTQIANYAFACDDDDYTMILFGAGCLYNCIPQLVSVSNEWSEPDLLTRNPSILPYTNTTMTYFAITRNVTAGEEMFVHYGDAWFEDRPELGIDIHADPPPLEHYTAEELEQRGVCLSNVFVATSNLPTAHRGLFAFKNFKRGELITVSPVLALPMDVVEETMNTSVLINYVWTESGAAVGIFPLGHAALLNHAPNVTRVPDGHSESKPATANVVYDWFDWTSRVPGGGYMSAKQGVHMLQMSFEDITNAPTAPLDLAFYADRDIMLGEELFIDYGEEWETAWVDWEKSLRDESHIFRYPIGLSRGLLPWHWFWAEEEDSTHLQEQLLLAEQVHLDTTTVMDFRSGSILQSSSDSFMKAEL